MPAPLLSSIVIGYGHAGRDFHVPAVRRLHAMRGVRGSIGVVDSAAPRVVEPAGVLMRPRLGDFCGRFSAPRTVVHICTPPDVHATVLRECADEGFTRIVVEKPLVTTRADLDAVRALARRRGLDVVVVANWLASRLTAALLDELTRRRGVRITGVDMISSKSRIHRSLTNDSHRSAFDVEMPHLVALALCLFGNGVRLVSASATNLIVSGRRVQHMAAARMVLRAPAHHDVRLVTDLQSPVRQRSVSIWWEDGTRLVGHFPADSEDVYSQLRVFGPDGALRVHRLFEDDTVLACLAGAYAHFEAGVGPADEGIAFHVAVTRLILDAKDRCGLPASRSLAAEPVLA